MWHGPLQCMASSLSHITICLCPSELLPSELTTHRPHHWFISTKLGWTYTCLMALDQYMAPIIEERRCEMRRKSTTNEVLKGDKVPLGDNRRATCGNCTWKMIWLGLIYPPFCFSMLESNRLCSYYWKELKIKYIRKSHLIFQSSFLEANTKLNWPVLKHSPQQTMCLCNAAIFLEWWHVICRAFKPGFSMRPRGAVWKCPPKMAWACAIEKGPLLWPKAISEARKASMYAGSISEDFRLLGMNVYDKWGVLPIGAPLVRSKMRFGNEYNNLASYRAIPHVRGLQGDTTLYTWWGFSVWCNRMLDEQCCHIMSTSAHHDWG